MADNFPDPSISRKDCRKTGGRIPSGSGTLVLAVLRTLHRCLHDDELETLFQSADSAW